MTISHRHRVRLVVGLLLLWISASVVAGIRVEAYFAPYGRCSKADAEGSSFDVGRTSVEWLPPAVRCSWDGRHPDERWFPVGTTALVAATMAGPFAVAGFLWWVVRRAERRAIRIANGAYEPPVGLADRRSG